MVINYKIETDEGYIVAGSKQINSLQMEELVKLLNIKISTKKKDPRQWDLEDMIEDVIKTSKDK